MTRARLCASLAAATLFLVGCGGSGTSAPGPVGSSAADATSAGTVRPITADEANRLAVLRFRLYQGRGAHVTVTGIPSSAGALALTGDVDYRNQIGYATVGGGGSTALVQWDRTRAAFWAAGSTAAAPPSAPPTSAAPARALDATKGDIDAILLILLQLGQDRPDNAQLLRQDGAAWVRSAQIGGVAVDVFDGPRASGATQSGPDSSVQYWVDAQGNPLRVTVALTGGSVTIDLDAGHYRPVVRSAAFPPS